MKHPIRLVTVMTTAMLASFAVSAFAESAPVFDVDAIQQQQQFESAAEQGQDLPPPPAPDGGAFVPMNTVAETANHTAATVTHAPATSGMSTAQRLRRIEQQLNNLQGTESGARIDSLQEQVQSLRGQVEQLLHQVDRLQTQQKAMYTDIDKRLQGQSSDSSSVKRAMNAGISDNSNGQDLLAASEAANAKTAAKGAKVSSAKQSVKTIVGANPTDLDAKKTVAANQPDEQEEQEAYQTAYNLIKAKKYNDAVDALQGMLKKYPSGQFASNAHYWLGELYGLMGKNDQALAEFSTVLEHFPQSPRVSDAQLKVGLIYSAQSKWTDAKLSFKKVMSAYPGTTSARVASEQLKQIKTSGH